MNGPEHYERSEKLLRDAEDTNLGSIAEASFIAEAQVHATLAVAAALATLDGMPVGPSYGAATGRSEDDSAAWRAVLS